MKQIQLTSGQFAIVDDADYDWLNQYRWYVNKNCSGGFYAYRKIYCKNTKKQHSMAMHREILGLKKGDPQQTDHINHNTLDNRRDNIRICTPQQNHFNRKSDSNSSSKFKGVSWYRQKEKWSVQIFVNGRLWHLGYWNIEEVAALRYDMVAIREFGEFAYLNF